MANNELTTIADRQQFVFNNHTCVVGYSRKSNPPSMSIVHYINDDGKIVFLTMAERQKAKAVNRNPQLSLCILASAESGFAWPPEYLVVDGIAEIITDMDYVVKTAMQVGSIMTGDTIPEDAEPFVREMMEKENRVAISVTPLSSFHSPSVHPEGDDADSAEKMVHGLGARLPWNE